jgi:hypothetical protein
MVWNCYGVFNSKKSSCKDIKGNGGSQEITCGKSFPFLPQIPFFLKRRAIDEMYSNAVKHLE